MDIHYRVAGLTAKAVAEAHQRDLAVQAKYGVNYRSYRYDDGSGRAPLSRGPSGQPVPVGTASRSLTY